MKKMLIFTERFVRRRERLRVLLAHIGIINGINLVVITGGKDTIRYHIVRTKKEIVAELNDLVSHPIFFIIVLLKGISQYFIN